jgi:hypothetical protein
MRDKVRDKSLTCLLPLTKFPPIAHIGTQQWRFNCGSFSSGVDHEGASRVAIRKSAPATSPDLNSQFDARRATLVIRQLAATPPLRRNDAATPQ